MLALKNVPIGENEVTNFIRMAKRHAVQPLVIADEIEDTEKKLRDEDPNLGIHCHMPAGTRRLPDRAYIISDSTLNLGKKTSAGYYGWEEILRNHVVPTVVTPYVVSSGTFK